MTRSSVNQPEHKTCHLVDFAIPADQRVKIQENEKINKYWILLESSKKMSNIKVTVIPIVSGRKNAISDFRVYIISEIHMRVEISNY